MWLRTGTGLAVQAGACDPMLQAQDCQGEVSPGRGAPFTLQGDSSTLAACYWQLSQNVQ